MKQICQIVLEKETFDFFFKKIPTVHRCRQHSHYNVRVVGSNPSGSREKNHFIFFYYITISILSLHLDEVDHNMLLMPW